MTDIYAFGENWAIPAPLRTKLDTVVSDWLTSHPQSDASLPGRVSTLETRTTENAAAITTKAPTAHTHPVSDVDGLPAALAGKMSATTTVLEKDPALGPNLDTVVTPGIYVQNASAGATLALGYPYGVAGSLVVAGDAGGMVYQEYTSYATTGSTAGRRWLRTKYNGAWGTWVQQALTTDPPAAHTHTITDVTGLDKITQAVNPKMVVVTAEKFGVDPTGVSDSTEGIRQALAAVPAGGTLYFPRGTYSGQAAAPKSEADYIVIDKPITITGDVGTVLRNIKLYIKGAFDTPVYLGAAATEGDQTITTASAHGWAPGDYVQVLSQYNAYTEDAGAYQLGSVNPTHGTTPVCQVSEIHRVSATPSTTTAMFLDLLMYGGYTTSPAPTPIPGVKGAQARRIKPVQGVRITGLTFENRVRGYRCILARGAADLVFEDCSFYSNDNPGFALRIFDTYNLVVRNCRFEKRTDTFNGSSWNSVIIGGGCTDVTFSGCTVAGEAQALDISPNAAVDSVADPGGTLTEYRSTQRIRLLGNAFINCSDGATTHPGTMDVMVAGNHVSGGATGFRIRSRRAQVLSNDIQTSRRGVSLEAFLTQSIVAGNQFMQVTSSKYQGFYAGVEYNPCSSEIISDNRAKLDVIGNTFSIVKGSAEENYAVMTAFKEPGADGVSLTNEWKNRRSDLVIANNTVRGGTILTANVTHGARIIGNQFSGGTDMSHYVMLQGTASVVHNNIFDDFTGHVKCYAAPRGGAGFTFPIENQIGSNATTGAALNYMLANAKTMLVKVGV